jgi:hypothetical protein
MCHLFKEYNGLGVFSENDFCNYFFSILFLRRKYLFPTRMINARDTQIMGIQGLVKYNGVRSLSKGIHHGRGNIAWAAP